jgi:hypothetical protein
LELPASFAAGNGSNPSVTVTTVTNNAWVFDTQGELLASLTPAAGAGQTEIWNDRTGGAQPTRVRGSGSYEGPVTPAGSVTMSWSWFTVNTDWAIGAVAIRPGNGGSSVLSWREVVQ